MRTGTCIVLFVFEGDLTKTILVDAVSKPLKFLYKIRKIYLYLYHYEVSSNACMFLDALTHIVHIHVWITQFYLICTSLYLEDGCTAIQVMTMNCWRAVSLL